MDGPELTAAPKVAGNVWNRIRYTLWAPLYDVVGRRFDGKRRESLSEGPRLSKHEYKVR